MVDMHLVGYQLVYIGSKLTKRLHIIIFVLEVLQKNMQDDFTFDLRNLACLCISLVTGVEIGLKPLFTSAAVNELNTKSRWKAGCKTLIK